MAHSFAQNEIPAQHRPPGLPHSDPKWSSAMYSHVNSHCSPAIRPKYVKQHIRMFIFPSGLLHVAFKCHDFLWLWTQFFLLFLTLYSSLRSNQLWLWFQISSKCRHLQPELSFELQEYILNGLLDIFTSLFQSQFNSQNIKFKSQVPLPTTNSSSSRVSYVITVMTIYAFPSPSPFISNLSLSPNNINNK